MFIIIDHVGKGSCQGKCEHDVGNPSKRYVSAHACPPPPEDNETVEDIKAYCFSPRFDMYVGEGEKNVKVSAEFRRG